MKDKVNVITEWTIIKNTETGETNLPESRCKCLVITGHKQEFCVAEFITKGDLLKKLSVRDNVATVVVADEDGFYKKDYTSELGYERCHLVFAWSKLPEGASEVLDQFVRDK